MKSNSTSPSDRKTKIFIYIFVLLNSISGLQIAGKSMNLYFMLLFVAFIAFYFLRYSENKINKMYVNSDPLVVFFCFSIMSCLLSMGFTYVLPHVSIVSSYLINSITYLVIYILLTNVNTKAKRQLVEVFKSALIFAARVQVIWGFLQLILIYGYGININQILFNDILKSTTSRDWIMGFYTGNTWQLRMTGLNFENSMFAMVLCIGLSLEKNKIWRLILASGVVLSLSRTGWVMLAGYYTVELINRIKNSKSNISSQKILKAFSFVILSVVSIVILYNKSEIFSRAMDNIFVRANDQSALSVSGARHFMYYPYGMQLFFSSNIIHMLFGYGMRCSGIPFSQHPEIMSILGGKLDYDLAWAVECDVIGLLLGGGIIVTIAYYSVLKKCISTNNLLRNAIFVIFFGGLTYHYHSISYIVLILIFSMTYQQTLKDKKQAQTGQVPNNIKEYC